MNIFYHVNSYYPKMCLFLRQACESALKEKHFLDGSDMEGFVDDATTTHLKQLEALEGVFNKAAEADIPAEVCTFFLLEIFCSALEILITGIGLWSLYRSQITYAVKSPLTFFMIL